MNIRSIIMDYKLSLLWRIKSLNYQFAYVTGVMTEKKDDRSRMVKSNLPVWLMRLPRGERRQESKYP